MSETLKFGNGEWATKKGSTLAYNDENGNFKPLPFTFDRSTSATRVNKEGLIEVVSNNEPRIDFLNDSKGALLLEPSRSNLVTYSEEFDNAYWDKSNVNISKHLSIKAPDGSYNANHIVDLGNGSIVKNPIASITDTKSIYVRTVSGVGKLHMLNFSNESDSLIDVDENWQRIEIPYNGQSFWERFYLCDFRALSTVSEILIWGAQVEQGSYATSYIPTQGSIGTRVAESCSDAGNDQVINSTEGVLYFEGSALADDNSDRKITLSDNSLDNAINFGYSRFSGNINAEVISGGVLQTSGFGATGVTQDNNNKFALSWGNGISRFYVNGTLASSYTNVNSPIGMNVLNFSQSIGSHRMYLNCKEIKVYNTALTDQELINLTTI